MARGSASSHGKPSTTGPGRVGAAAPRFLPFLPDDNNSLSNASSAEALQSISDELGTLLGLAAKEFWTVVVEDESLHKCLDSFLRFRRRGFDQTGTQSAEQSVMSEALDRQVFMVFLRMVTPVTAGTPGPTPAQQADLLYNRWIIDVPKLMDLAVLYGPDNLHTTQKLLTSLFSLQPAYLQDVANMVEPLAENLREVHARCNELCAKIGKGEIDSTANVLDAASYLVDACVTLKVFTEVYPPAGRLLLGPNDSAPLLGVLSDLHKHLLSALLHAVKQPAAAEAAQITAEQAKRKIDVVGVGIESLVHQLICSAFLSPIMSPAEAGQSLETRGEQLLTLLMSAAQPSAQGGGPHASDKPLVQQINAHFALDAAIVEAAQQGIISVDEAQFDYLMALLGSTTTLTAPTTRSTAAGSSSHSAATAAGAGGSGGSGVGSRPDPAVLKSLVTQVKEVLPDFGDGFVMACLEAYDGNAERVIHHLLEGSLPPHLSSLDTQLSSWPLPGGAGAITDKGKGKVTAEPAASVAPSSSLSWRGLAAQAEAAESAAARSDRTIGPGWDTSTSSSANAPRQVARSTLRALGGAGADVKSLTKQLGNGMQWDYDDEYDDSFDDLVNAGADGVADVEGDELRDKTQTRAEASDSGRGRGAAGPPSSSGGPGRGQDSRGTKTKLWVLDGRIYNYKKEGAQLVESHAAADKALEAAKLAAEAIYGLGAGGNVPLRPARDENDDREEDGDDNTRGPSAGQGYGGRGGGRGRGPPKGKEWLAHRHKDQNKAAVGNHHRKDRALKKMGFQP